MDSGSGKPPASLRGPTATAPVCAHRRRTAMNVLVTGGAGYIGSHAAKALAMAGHLPVCYDNLSRGHRWAVQWGPLVEGDLRDQAALRRALREHSIQAVMHFAAFAYVGESMLQPGMYFDNNCGGTVSLLEAMRLERVNQLIFSSTCATYGFPDSLPIAESAPQRPVNPYGESKLFSEKTIRWHARCHGLRYVILRYFNAAGCDPDLETGELHVPETHLIPLMIEAALDPSRQVEIFGTDYPTPDGTAVRDYVHVTDLASAHVLALEHLLRKPGCIDMNLGTGIGYSVKDVLDSIARVTGRHPATRLVFPAAGRPCHSGRRPAQGSEHLGLEALLLQHGEHCHHCLGVAQECNPIGKGVMKPCFLHRLKLDWRLVENLALALRASCCFVVPAVAALGLAGPDPRPRSDGAFGRHRGCRSLCRPRRGVRLPVHCDQGNRQISHCPGEPLPDRALSAGRAAHALLRGTGLLRARLDRHSRRSGCMACWPLPHWSGASLSG